jgi:hypothetical protein
VSEPRCARRGGQNVGVLRVAGDDNIQRERRRRADELGRTARLVRGHGWLALYAPAARMPIDNVERILWEADGADLDAVTERLLSAEREHMKKASRSLANPPFHPRPPAGTEVPGCLSAFWGLGGKVTPPRRDDMQCTPCYRDKPDQVMRRRPAPRGGDGCGASEETSMRPGGFGWGRGGPVARLFTEKVRDLEAMSEGLLFEKLQGVDARLLYA